MINQVNSTNFNDTMKGYIIRACKENCCTKEEFKKVLQGFIWAIHEMTYEEAREEYKLYRKGKIQFK